jgi:hypothetical protein
MILFCFFPSFAYKLAYGILRMKTGEKLEREGKQTKRKRREEKKGLPSNKYLKRGYSKIEIPTKVSWTAETWAKASKSRFFSFT